MSRPIEVHITSDDRASPLCDFCGDPLDLVARWYPVTPFSMAVVLPETGEWHEQNFMDDGWAACLSCALAIDADNPLMLLAQFQRAHPDGSAAGLELVTIMYANFFANLTGPGVTYTLADGTPKP